MPAHRTATNAFAEAAEARVAVPRPARRILLVEDDDAVATMLVAVLSCDADVDHARSADEAMDRLDAQPYEIVLTDVDLGAGPSGLTLLAAVAAAWPGVRRIAMSGTMHATRETLLVKPLSSQDLGAILARRA